MNIFIMLWATFSLVFIVLEIGHPSLLFYLPLSLASSIAALAAYYEYLFINQMTVFFFSSAITIWLFKKFLKKMHGSSYRTNVYALVGKEALVTSAISSDAPGYVKVQGELWLARSLNASLPPDSRVKIVEVRGAHVIVEPYN
jgi:membrane protein implicated in regulation of membrane protease activity